MKELKTFTHKIDDTEIEAKFTDLAENSTGSVLMKSEDTSVLVTVVMSKEEKNIGYFPLSVEFEERFYSIGEILGSRFMRREGRPSQDATLSARIIDRSIRPLFPKGLKNEIQVIATTLSIGKTNPDVLALLGASIALSTSKIPWNGPVSGIRLSKINNNWKAFGTVEECRDSEGEFLICGKDNLISMVEMEGSEIGEDEAEVVLKEAVKIIEGLQGFQNEIIKEVGKQKVDFTAPNESDRVKEMFKENIEANLYESVFGGTENKLDELTDKWKELLKDVDEKEREIALDYLEREITDLIQKEAVLNGKRIGDRGLDDLREIHAKAGGISEIIHGTGIFYRGKTHVLSALTLGGPEDALLVNTVGDTDLNEKFIHHYNFPPFAAGETGRVGTPNRRMIGHGALAEKALRQVIPNSDEFPYTIRLVSECFSSNGSTSMGSVCASTIAMMDGGVPIKRPVAGIAIGVAEHDGKFAILTDIQGLEDHYGGMDLKIAGTKAGITAMQMDVKLDGLPLTNFIEALEKGKIAREKILDVITKEIEKPRDSISSNAPHIKSISIPVEMIGMLIGPGGKNVKSLKEIEGVNEITIEDTGLVYITGDKNGTEIVFEKIKNMTKVHEIGEEIDGVITNITSFGAFVDIGGEKEGLVHISEFSPERIERVDDLVSVGDKVPVIIKNVNKELNRIDLSIKDRDADYFKGKTKSIKDRGADYFKGKTKTKKKKDYKKRSI